MPALSLPLPGPSRLPVGLQVVAASDEQALSCGMHIADALDV
jgi:Asp-tRNA(Asn)/Glu-tRNA(Gln) amidotransferase A subunit family amidase